MRYWFLYGKRTLKARRPYADGTFRTRYQHAEGSSRNWHILCPPTSAYCGRSVSVRLPRRGRAERSLTMCIACSLRTGRTPAYAENFCACIKFLGVWNELWRTSAYDNVLWTFAQRAPDALPTCISVWQKVVIRRQIRWYVTAPLAKKILTKNNSRYFMKKLSWNHGRWIRSCKDFQNRFSSFRVMTILPYNTMECFCQHN